MLRQCNVLLILFLGCTSVALGQSGSGRVFVAPGGVSNGGGEFVLHFGGGGEVLVAGGFGISGDLGYLFEPDGFGNGVGVFSPGGIFQFNRDQRTVPFITGGYTLWFRSGTLSFGHAGVGVNHWFTDHLGLRVEARDHFRSGENLFEGRFALLFR